MGKKPTEPPVNIWEQYKYLTKPTKKIMRLAEIARTASTAQIQYPVQRITTGQNGENEITSEIAPPVAVGQYEEIFRLLLMKCLNSCDIEGI